MALELYACSPLTASAALALAPTICSALHCGGPSAEMVAWEAEAPTAALGGACAGAGFTPEGPVAEVDLATARAPRRDGWGGSSWCYFLQRITSSARVGMAARTVLP